MLRVCILGLGRTGKEIAKVIMQQADLNMVLVVCRSTSKKAGKDLGEILGSQKTGVRVTGSQNLEQNLLRYRRSL